MVRPKTRSQKRDRWVEGLLEKVEPIEGVIEIDRRRVNPDGTDEIKFDINYDGWGMKVRKKILYFRTKI